MHDLLHSLSDKHSWNPSMSDCVVLLVILGRSLFLLTFLGLPAVVILILVRVPASLFCEDAEILVLIDRTGSGRLVLPLDQQTNAPGMFDAWKSLNAAALRRLRKLHWKVIASKVALAATYESLLSGVLSLMGTMRSASDLGVGQT